MWLQTLCASDQLQLSLLSQNQRAASIRPDQILILVCPGLSSEGGAGGPPEQDYGLICQTDSSRGPELPPAGRGH